VLSAQHVAMIRDSPKLFRTEPNFVELEWSTPERVR
jgi:hypothetical protein